MAAHIYGHPCDMQPICDIARKYQSQVIKVAVEVHGAAFSFFANKNATTSGGGMVVTDNEELANRCRYFSNLCFRFHGPRLYIHNGIGFNYRMSDVHAAIGLAQVQRLDMYVEMRRRNNIL